MMYGCINDLRFSVLFNITSVISRRFLDKRERLCAMEFRLRLIYDVTILNMKHFFNFVMRLKDANGKKNCIDSEDTTLGLHCLLYLSRYGPGPEVIKLFSCST